MTKVKSSTNLVKFHNDLNVIAFKGMKKMEFDILFALLFRFQNTGLDEQNINFSELKQILELGKYTNKQIQKLIEGLAKNLVSTLLTTKSEKGERYFTLFEYLEVGTTANSFSIAGKINPQFKYLLNNLKVHFTLLDLSEFISLKSRYSQTLYRLLRQYRKQGYLYIKMEDFRSVMGVPASYNSEMIDRRVLKVCIDELSSEKEVAGECRILFKHLSYDKVKTKSRGRGGKIIAYEFSFYPEDKDRGEINKISQQDDDGITTSLMLPPKINPITKEIINDFARFENQTILFVDFDDNKKTKKGIVQFGFYDDQGEVNINLKVIDLLTIYETFLNFKSFYEWELHFNKCKV